MQIRPTNQTQITQAVNLQPQNTTSSVGNDVASAPVDQLDISIEAKAMTGTEVSGIRADRVAELRAQIASGNYETSERIGAAVERLFDVVS